MASNSREEVMRKRRFSEEQMVKILREADKAPVAEVSKKHGVSEQTIYTWRKRFGAMNADEVKRLRQLEVENARLKKMLAERKGLSRRRACALLDVSRSCLGYVSRLDVRDRPVIEQMQKLAGQYPRYGYRRIRIFLRRAGVSLSIGRTWRLWAKAGLQVPRKRPRRRVASQRDQVQRAPAANHVWAYDFVFDTCANSQQLKCLTVIDEHTREALAIDVAGSIRSERVVEVLSRLISERGAPKFLRSDNGPEFVSTRLLQWAADEGLQMALSQPGKPWQNGTDESFNGKFRDECLSMEYFRNRTQARVVIEQWRRHYNAVRPHSALGYLTPAQFVESLSGKDHEATSLK
jgi:putative transposase